MVCTSQLKRRFVLRRWQGVGPATASAILAAFSDAFPFMSDEALEILQDGSKPMWVTLCLMCMQKKFGSRADSVANNCRYNMKEYMELCSRLRLKASELNQLQHADEPRWTAARVEQCLWSHAQESNRRSKDLDSGLAETSSRKLKRQRQNP